MQRSWKFAVHAKLHKLLKVSKNFKKPDAELTAYDVAHHAGLSLEEEYELLHLFRKKIREEAGIP